MERGETEVSRMTVAFPSHPYWHTYTSRSEVGQDGARPSFTGYDSFL